MPRLRVFYALIEEVDGEWTMTFPDLPSVTVSGDSREQVIEAGDVALAAALAADPLIYPGSYEDVSTRVAVKVALQLGKELVAMPG